MDENREGQNSKENRTEVITNTPSNKAFGGKIFDEDKFE